MVHLRCYDMVTGTTRILDSAESGHMLQLFHLYEELAELEHADTEDHADSVYYISED